jgi:hypothetical protein
MTPTQQQKTLPSIPPPLTLKNKIKKRQETIKTPLTIVQKILKKQKENTIPQKNNKHHKQHTFITG